MDLISPTRTTTTLQRGNCIAFLVSFAIVLAGLTSSVRTPIWVVVMSMACLAFGWLLTATLITHITSDLGPICDPPDIQAEFRAMSQIPLTIRLVNPSDRSSLLFLTAEVLVECEGHLLQTRQNSTGVSPPVSEENTRSAGCWSEPRSLAASSPGSSPSPLTEPYLPFLLGFS